MMTTALLPLLRRLGGPRVADGSDTDLLRAFVSRRCPEAFRALVERHGPLVWSICQRVAGPDAEDACQAVFLALAQRAAAVRRPNRLVGWLYGVALRVARKAVRTRVRRRRHETNLMVTPSPDPVADLSARELMAALDEELQRLPERYRLPLLLVYWQGLSQDEAARRLGWSPGSVKGRLERGRKRLAERLKKRGFAGQVLLAAMAAVTVPADLIARSVSQAAAPWSGAVPYSVTMLAVGAGSTRQLLAVATATLFLLGTGALAWVAFSPGRQPAPAQPAVPKPQAAKEDQLGDPLPEGAVARMGTLRFRHWGPLQGAAWSPDGKRLATAGSNDNQVRLWDATTGRLLASVPGSTAAVFTRDGSKLFHCGGNANAEAKLLNVATLREEDSPLFAVNSKCLALSPDGRWLALDIWSDKPPHVVRVCDLTTGEVRLRLAEHQKPVSCVSFSPDGKLIATAGDEAVIRLWDATTGKLVRRLDGHQPVVGYRDHMLSVAFSPDGKLLVSGGVDKTVRLWDVANGKELRRLGEHKARLLCVAFTPDGKQALTGGFEEPIRVWDAATGKEVRRFPKRSEWAARIAFAPSGKTIAVVVWGGRSPRFWEIETGREVGPTGAPEAGLTGALFSPDGRTLTTIGDDDTIREWQTDTGRELYRWEKDPDLVSNLARSPDGQILAAGDYEGVVYLWRADTGQEVRRLQGHKRAVLHVVFAPDGQMLASTGNDGTVRLWEVGTGKEIRRFTGHERYANQATFFPDARTIATTAEDHSVRLWRVTTGEELRRIKTQHLQNNAVAVSPDGRLLLVASVGDQPVQVWDAGTGRELPPFAIPRNEASRIFSLAFAPDGRTLATGGEDGVIRLWEVSSRQERRRFTGHTGWAYRVVFSPDGSRVASVSNDTTAVIWNVAGLSAEEQPLAAALTDEGAKALWAGLAGEAARADYVIRLLSAAPDRALPLLRGHLKPAGPVAPAQLARWIADLDHSEFTTREAASRELEAIGDVAVPSLQKALQAQPSAEACRRIQELLDRQPLPSTRQLQSLRAVEVLERIGTADAKELLLEIAKGAPDARLTKDAAAAVERLQAR